MKMKNPVGALPPLFPALSLLLCLTAPSLWGQVQTPGVITDTGAATITESGPDFRAWQNLDAIRASAPGNGHMVELATGLNYWDGTNWSPSVPQFQPNPQDSSFVAGKVQHQTRISSDINVAGAVGITTPDGQVLSSTPIGIGLFDAASGAFQLIATVTNTPGVMLSSNQVYFENAFSGGACASILYTIEQDSFAQDIIFTGYLDPAAYGFPTNTTRIQIITEFYQPPTPEVLSEPMYVESDPTLRQTMASPDLIDETLTFGRVVFGVGQAYTVPTLLEPSGSASLVGKEMVQTRMALR